MKPHECLKGIAMKTWRGRQVQELMGRYQMTQAELGRRLGCSQPYVFVMTQIDYPFREKMAVKLDLVERECRESAQKIALLRSKKKD